MNRDLIEDATPRIDRDVVDDYRRRGPEIAARMTRAIVGEVPDYAPFAGTSVEREILGHCTEHVDAFAAWAEAECRSDVLDLTFVRERGRAQVQSPIPLSALLRTYVIGQRITWTELALAGDARPRDPESLMRLTSAAFAYADAITTAVTEAYVEAEVAAAGTDEATRRDLVEALISGAERAASVADRVAGLGIGSRGGHVVAVAVLASPEPGAERIGAARSAFEEGMRIGPGSGLACSRQDEIVAVAPLEGARPEHLRERLEEVIAKSGPAIAGLRAGIGLRGERTEDVAGGYAEAKRALEHASSASPVIALAEVRLTDYVAWVAGPTASRLIPERVRSLAESDARASGTLRSTLTAFAEEGMNVSAAAKRLYVHPNTVRYRLRKVGSETGLDPLRFEDLDELLTALRLARRR